ncbi:hypothetical protein [Tessaracoccus palaemonis]|uniref:Tetratricopeptide repeat protein n=1 Tax=Tessaracoccus palaemonis TaxID=2829499 RepID=A0ABX8SJR2_9ACTN|nr:hypothetical protein [Tessaracoccus palaemonis]QXT63601.1 hypothetical protein KDB89_03750 [Tessaracoccus palaemonis]
MRTRRQVLARRWLVATTLPAIALLCAAAVLGFQLAAVQVGLARTDRGDHAGAAEAFAAAETLPVVDSWVPAFDRGTAQYRLRQWDAAADSFERAMGRAPVGVQCRVLLNWAWSLEAGADQLADTDKAGSYARLTQAQLILSTAPCGEEATGSEGDDAPSGDLQDQLDDTSNRLSEKSGQTQPDTEADDETDDSDNSEQLADRQQQAEQQRRQVEDRTGEQTTDDGQKTW